MTRTIDYHIGDLLGLQAKLIAATRDWARGEIPAPALTETRHQALILNHRRYVELIPAYRRLADSMGLAGKVDLDTVINNLMFTDELFKSYDPRWLDDKQFDKMTGWISSIFSQDIEMDCSGIEGIHDWRSRLKQHGVFLSYSSGTSGPMSFVPRDPMTWNALRRNSSIYANPNSIIGANGKPQPFDCLVAAPRGEGMGIQGAAAGLSRLATRSHYLFDSILDEDSVHRMTTTATKASVASNAASTAERYRQAAEFIQRSVDEQQPLLIFGAPFQLRRLCEQLQALQMKFTAPADSTVVTGGGWKSFLGERIPQKVLTGMIEQTFAIKPSRFIDAYSTAELNCAMISCSEGHYHIPPLIEPVILDDALFGASGQAGQGTLGFLDPFSMSFPGFLITGDTGTLNNDPCPCGLSGWYIDGEVQRAPDKDIKGCGGVMAAVTA